MTGDELQRRLSGERVVDPIDVPSGEQLRLLSELGSLYEHEGLVRDAGTPPLWECCPLSADCRRNAWHCRPPRRQGRSGITLPWVGPEYRAGGVAVIAINLRDAGGLLQEYEITCESAGDSSQLNRLAAGHRTAHGSRLAYGSTRSAAVLDWLEESTIVDQEAPDALPSVLNRIVRLQAVKCSPDDRRRSSPTPAMAVNCPRLLLEREIDLIRPSALLTVGSAAWRAIYDMDGYGEAPGGSDRLSYGTLRIRHRDCWVFSLDHPASGGLWDRGHQDLIRELPRLKRVSR